MPPRTTIVVSIDPVTQKLVTIPDSVDVVKGDEVIWQKTPGADIQWIHIGTRNHPFNANLPSGNWIGVPVTVRRDAPTFVWKYRIIYRTSKGIDTLDPKIAIHPSKNFPTFFSSPLIIVPLLLVITALTTLNYFRISKLSKLIKKFQENRS